MYRLYTSHESSGMCSAILTGLQEGARRGRKGVRIFVSARAKEIYRARSFRWALHVPRRAGGGGGGGRYACYTGPCMDGWGGGRGGAAQTQNSRVEGKMTPALKIRFAPISPFPMQRRPVVRPRLAARHAVLRMHPSTCRLRTVSHGGLLHPAQRRTHVLSFSVPTPVPRARAGSGRVPTARDGALGRGRS